MPAQIPADVFWARYFFRVTQIEADDARRKQVLESELCSFNLHPNHLLIVISVIQPQRPRQLEKNTTTMTTLIGTTKTSLNRLLPPLSQMSPTPLPQAQKRPCNQPHAALPQRASAAPARAAMMWSAVHRVTAMRRLPRHLQRTFPLLQHRHQQPRRLKRTRTVTGSR